MKIEIKAMRLKNFKGKRSLSVEFGKETRVFGDNETGKTTIFDAFTWLLFDKDSLSRSNFGIKTLDTDGNVIEKIDHEVEALLTVDGKETIFRKVYKEKWTKSRGSAKETFDGHTVDFFIDEVPVKKSEFTDKIASLIDEKVFRLITDPRNFNEQLHWKDRRNLLLEICGDITDEEVVASEKKLASLLDSMAGKDIEDYRKMIGAKLKAINDELQMIPVRVDEVEAGKPDISDFDFKSIEQRIKELSDTLSVKRQEIASINSGGQIAKLEGELATIESAVTTLKMNHDKDKHERLGAVDASIRKLEGELYNSEREVQKIDGQIKDASQHVDKWNQAIQSMREEWQLVYDREFVYQQESVCPTCGQAIPEHQLEEARQKALEQFNLQKSRELEVINFNGKKAKEVIAEQQAEIKGLEEKRNAITRNELAKLKESITELKAKREEYASGIKDVTSLPEYLELQEKKREIVLKIASLKEDSREQANIIQMSIHEADSEIQSLRQQLAMKDLAKKADSRISELKASEEKLAKDYEKLEKELYLTELFIKTKVNLLDSKINSKFKLASFKMFNQQVNGGIAECCETVYKGVPYSDLNNAARINVGVDIINTLTEHFRVTAPIFIDNRESVTKLVDSNSQIINLIVSEPDKKLRIEVA